MTTYTASVLPSNTSDANFRAWGKAISDGFAAIGLVQTADTGQINWTTVTRPSSSYSYQGYEIWRFNDAMQATCPIFLKIQYGTGASSSNVYVNVLFGFGSNGAGGLTGNLSATFESNQGNTWTVGVAQPIYMQSSNAGSLNMMLFPGSGAGSADGNQNESVLGLFVDRTRNADGTPNGSGILIFKNIGKGATEPPQVHSLNRNGTKQDYCYKNPCCVVPMYTITSLTEGTEVSVIPFTPYSPKLHAPCPGFVVYMNTDISRGTNFTLPMYGADRTFKALGTWQGNSLWCPTATAWQAHHCVAMRWE